MARNVPALAALVCGLLVAGWLDVNGAQAQIDFGIGDAPFEISADTIDYERERDVYVARGNVQLVQRNQTLSADWVSFSRSGGRGVASGRVVFSDGTDTIYANFVQFNIETLQGVMFLARFDDSNSQFRLEGEEIVKTGDKTYTFERGVFTSCRCPDDDTDPWQLRAESADLDLGGYAIARNTTVNILGVPVIWLPWMAYPLSTERETGFLFPEFSYNGRDGIRIGVPFFWAAAPNVNVTLTPRWLQKRGVKGELDAEYLIGEKSSGSLAGAYINDDSVNSDSRDDPFGAHRWMARGTQDFHLPYGWRAKSKFTFVSDNRYLRDFRDLRKQNRYRYLESNAFLFNQFGATDQFGFVLSTQVADDLQSPDEVDRDPYMLHRVPNLELKILPQPLPVDVAYVNRLVPSLDVQYTYFGQLNNPSETFPTDLPFTDSRVPINNTRFYDVGIDALADGTEGPPGGDAHNDDFLTSGGPEGDGTFQEGEPLADRGHRLQVAPRLAAPFRIGNYVEVYPEIGYRQSVYDTREQGFTGWGSITARVDMRTRLHRGYGSNVVHLMEPHLSYALVEHPDIDDEPLFSPYTARPQHRIRHLALENITRDSSDEPRDFNGFTIGLGNRFYREGQGSRSAKMLADFNLGFLFDFSSGGRIGTFVLDGHARPAPNTELKVGFGLDPDGFTVEELLLEAAWRGEKLASVLRYRYLDRVPNFFEDFQADPDRFDDFEDDFDRVNQVDLTLRYQFTRSWSARHRIAYSLENSILLVHSAAVEYLSKCNCWAGGVEVRQSRSQGFQFRLLYRLVGLGKNPSRTGQQGLGDLGFLEGF